MERSRLDTDNIPEITATDFAELYAKDKTIHLLDARKESEFTSQHIKGAKNFPLDFINSNMGMLQKDNKYYIHCASGYRSLITVSILKSRGFDVVNIKGGFKALSATKLEKTAYKAQATML